MDNTDNTFSAASVRIRHVLITGPPGIGKTTVCKKTIPLIENNGLTCDGFFTEEIRSSNNKRIGFNVVPLKFPEHQLPLARGTQVLEPQISRKYRVGNYVVFLENLEKIALPVFQTNSNVLLIDEIGKMELFSKPFAKKLNEVVFSEESVKSNRCMLATIPAIEQIPAHLTLIQELRSNPCCKIIRVDHKNRDNLPEDITKMILNIVKNK